MNFKILSTKKKKLFFYVTISKQSLEASKVLIAFIFCSTHIQINIVLNQAKEEKKKIIRKHSKTKSIKQTVFKDRNKEDVFRTIPSFLPINYAIRIGWSFFFLCFLQHCRHQQNTITDTVHRCSCMYNCTYVLCFIHSLNKVRWKREINSTSKQ